MAGNDQVFPMSQMRPSDYTAYQLQTAKVTQSDYSAQQMQSLHPGDTVPTVGDADHVDYELDQEQINIEQMEGGDKDKQLLRYGDIIYISRMVMENYVKVKTYISSEGISDRSLNIAFLDKENADSERQRFWLFEVQPYYQHETPKDSDPNERHDINKKVIDKARGKKVIFGDRIQLKHTYSDGFVTITRESGRNHGSWKIIVEPKGSERSWIQMKPADKKRRLGDNIGPRDAFKIVFTASQLDMYLFSHYSDKTKLWKVNGYSVGSIWNFLRFESFDADSKFVRYGVPVLIRQKEFGSKLIGKITEDFDLRFDEKPGEVAPNQDTVREDQPDIVLMNSEFEFHCYWIFERIGSIFGGLVEWGKSVRIRSATTGKYLGYDLNLTERPSGRDCFQLHHPISRKTGNISLKDQFLIKHHEKFLIVNEHDVSTNSLRNLIPVMDDKQSGYEETYEQSLQFKNVQRTEKNYIFEMERVNARHSDFIVRLSNFIPLANKLIYIIKHFNDPAPFVMAGILDKDLSENSLHVVAKRYKAAIERSLLSLSIEGAVDNVIYSNRQSTLVGLSIHLYLISFLKTVLNKIKDLEYGAAARNSYSHTQMRKATRHMSRKLSVGLKGGTIANKQIRWRPESEIIFAATKEAMAASFKLLWEMVYNNSYTCEQFSLLISEIMDLIVVGNISDDVSMTHLLSEVYSRVELKIADPWHYFRVWIKRLQTITEDSCEEQAVFIKLIRQVVNVEWHANFEYQRALADLLLSEHDCPLIHLGEVDGEITVKFCQINQQKMRVEEFLSENWPLQEIARFEDDEEDNIDAIYFYLSDIDDKSEERLPYTYYIYESVMLLGTLCQNQYRYTHDKLMHEYGFDPELVLQLAFQDSNRKKNLQYAFIRLANFLIVQNPFSVVFTKTKNKDMWFLLGEDVKRYTTELKRQSRALGSVVQYDKYQKLLTECVLRFWLKPEDIDWATEDLVDLMYYFIHVIGLTHSLIDVKYKKTSLVSKVSIALVGIFTKPHSNGKQYVHWAIEMLKNAQEESRNNFKVNGRLNKIYRKSLELIKLILRLKHQNQLEKLLKGFHENSHILVEQSQSLLAISDITQETTDAVIKIFTDALIENDNDRVLTVEEAVTQNTPFYLLFKTLTWKREKTTVNPEEEIEMVNQSPDDSFCVDDNIQPAMQATLSSEVFKTRRFLLELLMSGERYTENINDELVNLTATTFNNNKLIGRYLDHIEIIADEKYAKLRSVLAEMYRNIDPSSIPNHPRPDPSEEILVAYSNVRVNLQNVLEMIQLRGRSSHYSFTKTQNIMRHLQFYKKFMQIYEKFEGHFELMKRDEEVFELFSTLITIIYYFTLDNKQNRRKILKRMVRHEADFMVYRSADMIRELNHFDHMNTEQAKTFFDWLRKQATQEDGQRNKLRYFSIMMFEMDGTPRRDFQTLAARYIIELLTKYTEVMMREKPRNFAWLLMVLGLAAKGNHEVSGYIRNMFKLDILKAMMQTMNHSNYDIIHGLLSLVMSCYIVERDVQNTDITFMIFFLEFLGDLCRQAKSSIPDLIEIAEQSLYECVFVQDNPSQIDINFNNKYEYNSKVDFWRLISCQDKWETGSGVVLFIIDYLNEEPITRVLLKASLSKLNTAVQSLLKALTEAADLNEQLNFEVLNERVHQTADALMAHEKQKWGKFIKKQFRYSTGSKTYAESKIREHEVFKANSQFLVGMVKKKLSAQLLRHSDSHDKSINEKFMLFTKIFQENYPKKVEYEEISRASRQLPQIANFYSLRSFNLKASVTHLKNLSGFFVTHKHRRFFYDVLRALFPNETTQIEDREIEPMELKKLREQFGTLYYKSDIVKMCIDSLSSQKDDDEMLAAIQLLIQIFTDQSSQFQEDIRNYLYRSQTYHALFQYIKQELQYSKQRIIMLSKHKDVSSLVRIDPALLYFYSITAANSIRSLFQKLPRQEIIRNCIELLQLCCDNCCFDFQSFMRTQGQDAKQFVNEEIDRHSGSQLQQVGLNLTTRNSVGFGHVLETMLVQKRLKDFPDINLVDEVAAYMVELADAQEFIKIYTEAKRTIIACLETLVDFATGPCVTNQLLLGLNIRLIKFMKYLLRLTISETMPKETNEEDTSRVSSIRIYWLVITFLNTLLEGEPDPDPKIVKCISKQIGIKFLAGEARRIYNLHIKGREYSISLNLQTNDDYRLDPYSFDRPLIPGDLEIISSGVNIAILLIKLQPKHQRSSKHMTGFFESPEYLRYYTISIGHVEILKNDVIQSHYFHIPSKCNFMSKYMQKYILQDASIPSAKEKFQAFVIKTSIAKIEMNHQQRIRSARPFLKNFSQHYEKYGWASFCLICVINIVLVVQSPEREEISYTGSSGFKVPFLAITVLGILQLILALMSFFFYIYEFYPVKMAELEAEAQDFTINTYAEWENNDSVKMKPKYKQTIQERRSMENRGTFRALIEDEEQSDTVRYFLVFIWLIIKGDPKMIWQLFIFVVSFLAIAYNMFYCVLLLDWIKRSTHMQNILKAVYFRNSKRLLQTFGLLLICIYIFSAIGFIIFQQYYASDSNAEFQAYADTLYQTFESSVFLGIIIGGGIGGAIGRAEQIQDRYNDRVIWDLLFFLICILILMNIIIGTIIDTFSDLREEDAQRSHDLNQKCFICGMSKAQIELTKGGWGKHFMYKHSIFAYLSFLIYIDEKPANECTGLEKYVQGLLKENDLKFFPYWNKS